MGWIIRKSIGCIAVLGVVSGYFLPAIARADYFESRFHTVDSFQLIQASEPITVDVDGDGAEDVVFAGTVNLVSAIFVVGMRDQGITGFKQDILLPQGFVTKRLLASATVTGPSVVAFTEAGAVRTYGGWPLVEQAAFDIGSVIVSAAVGDVDNDGSVDLVVSADNEIRVYRTATGELLRALSVPVNYNELALAQVDADPALEILPGANAPGLIVDGATLGIDWGSPSSLGGRFAVGEIDRDRITPVAATTGFGNMVTLFNGIPWVSTNTLFAGSVQGFAARDLGGTSGDSVMVTPNDSRILVFDAAPFQLRREFPLARPALSIGAADVRGDQTRELAYLSGYQSGSEFAKVTIADSENNHVDWEYAAIAKPLTRAVIGDIDGDGRLELVAMGSTVSEWKLGSIIISDLLTGLEEWRAPSPDPIFFDPLEFAAARLLLRPQLTGIGMDIVITGLISRTGQGEMGQISIVDGVSKRVIYHHGLIDSNSPLYGRSITDSDLYDFNHDGVQDILVGASSLTRNGALLMVYSGTDRSLLWSSEQLGTGSQQINNVMVLGRDGLKPKFLVALPDRLIAYHARTGLRSWEWMVANHGVTLLPDPVLGDELAIHRLDGTVNIYSAETRALRRSFTLPTPLTGLFALPGSRERFLAMHGEALALIDNRNGTVVAETESLGPAAEPVRPPAAYKVNDATWQIAIGSQTKLYRKLLVVDDPIFVGTFDSSR